MNVKMLTEGVDVPDVKTVMITRQTTSNILLTQMIGRALRGEKAGGGIGKDYANVVFFHDTWKRVLPWANANIEGGLDNERPVTQGRNSMSLISIQLIKLATADIEYRGFENADFLTFIPIGFFGCEYTISIAEGAAEELVSSAESVIVYEFNKDKYDTMLESISAEDLTEYASENLLDSELKGKAEEFASRFFDRAKDNFDDMLIDNIIKLIRHLAQNGSKPKFIDFHERDLYDMDKLADELLNTPPLDTDIILTNKFNDEGLHWKFLYKGFDNFMDAYYKAQKRVLAKRRGQPVPPTIKPVEESVEELTDEIKRQVFARDRYTCLCCGKERRKGVPLNADHIQPITMGGRNVVSNLQTLCKYCNTAKGVNQIDYRTTITPLRQPKQKPTLYEDIPSSDTIENAIARIVNEFYHCRAMCELLYHERSNGRCYYSWEIVLFSGNNPEWLKAHSAELLGYVKSMLGWEHVTEIVVRNYPPPKGNVTNISSLSSMKKENKKRVNIV